jgi:hypothetical protein
MHFSPVTIKFPVTKRRFPGNEIKDVDHETALLVFVIAKG